GCAGDFWGVYPLDERGRMLVAIGDVTGHGVASATVTAAAAAACDVIVRRMRDKLDLAELVAALDIAVRRVGRGELQMTCFASILDPEARTISYVSCGQTTPYVCRAGAGEVELTAPVGHRARARGGVAMKLRVLSYNIHKCIGGVDRRYDPTRIGEVIRALDSDVVLLQEVDANVPRSNHDHQVDVVGELIGLRYRS